MRNSTLRPADAELHNGYNEQFSSIGLGPSEKYKIWLTIVMACNQSAETPAMLPLASKSMVNGIVFLLCLITPAVAERLSQIQVHLPAERSVIAALTAGKAAHLSGAPGDRKLSADFLQAILSVPLTNIPSSRLVIQGALVDDEFFLSGDQTVPFSVIFVDCTFRRWVSFTGVRFERNLEFIDSTFQRLRLDHITVKGDVLFSGVTASSSVSLVEAHVDGSLAFRVLNSTPSIQARGVKAESLDLYGADNVKTLDLSQLETDSLSIGADVSQTNIGMLQLDTAIVRGALRLQNATVDDLIGRGLRAGSLTAFGPRATIRHELNLSSANLGLFEWRVAESKAPQPSPSWPTVMLIDGLSFWEISVIGDAESRNQIFGSQVNGWNRPAPESSPRDLTVDFLEKAEFTDSAFSAQEQLLRRRGKLSAADHLYFDMRKKRRSTLWRDSRGEIWVKRIPAAYYYCLDWAQGVFFGYNRSALEPLRWSFIFIMVGTIVFWAQRKRGRIEQVSINKPVRFSPFWYSAELFLPLVNFGIADCWSPRRSSRYLITYVRVHQFAGWILIPVAFAALTGITK